jgi:hypothetical protein
MSEKPSHVVDRIETKAAKSAERERVAHSAWADVHDASKARDEKTERLKAQRLAQQAEQKD